MSSPPWQMTEWSLWAAKDRETRVVVCDPAALLVAKPLSRALTPGAYQLLAQSNADGRVAALLLRRKKAGAAVTIEPGEDIAIDTAAIALIGPFERERLLAARDRDRALRVICEAPRGAFTVPVNGNEDDVFGFASLVPGDGRASTRWLLDRKKQIVALYVALPPVESADASTILSTLPPSKK